MNKVSTLGLARKRQRLVEYPFKQPFSAYAASSVVRCAEKGLSAVCRFLVLVQNGKFCPCYRTGLHSCPLLTHTYLISESPAHSGWRLPPKPFRAVPNGGMTERDLPSASSPLELARLELALGVSPFELALLLRLLLELLLQLLLLARLLLLLRRQLLEGVAHRQVLSLLPAPCSLQPLLVAL